MQHHHAYLYEGSRGELAPLVASAQSTFRFVEEQNPDFHVREYEKFGIDEARELITLASLRPATGQALFILAVSALSSEAQQALLKLFEEPTPGIIFLLLTPPGIVLPTLRSRLLEYPACLGGEETQKATAATFLAAPYATRSNWIGGFLKEEEGARERVRLFLGALESLLHQRLSKENTRDLREGLEDIAHFRGYLADRSPSLKMLLEHLAATLPRTQ